MRTKILNHILGLVILVTAAVGCTKDFDEINTDPNNPVVVPTTNLITTAQRTLTDDIFDEWFSGRQGLLWAQYWAQRNYTSEDRFSIRQPTNNTYFRLIYSDLMDAQEIINIASNPDRRAEIEASYGDPDGQIAVAKVLKAYVFQLLASTYGDIPYEEAFDAVNTPTPAYSTQKVIFLDLFSQLKEAADYLEGSSNTVFTSGDIMYDGDPEKWARFANSLRLKLAIRLSNVTDADLVAARNTAIAEASDNPFQSNDDNAGVTYVGDGTSNAPLYIAFYVDNRNDFTVTAQFVDLLKGINDTLNNTDNPFSGMVDPRLKIWVPRARSDSAFRGMPYGLEDKETGSLWSSLRISNFKYPPTSQGGSINPVLQADANVVWMDYAEVCFILSELNNWDQGWYEEGVRASMERWGVDEDAISSYLEQLPPADEENVLTQKYIALYMNGYEAWAEYRRTGYPESIIEVGEMTGPTVDGNAIPFTAIVGNAIPRRLTYPVQEYTINAESVNNAASSIGGDVFGTRLIWDVNQGGGSK